MILTTPTPSQPRIQELMPETDTDPEFTLPLGEELLRNARASLIKQKAPPKDGPPASPALFPALLQTALTPALTQAHRALACDALSTYLLRSRQHPQLLPLPAAPPPWPLLAAVVMTHFGGAQSALSKALKDLFGNVLSAHPDPGPFAMGLLHAGGATTTKVSYYVLEAVLRKRVVAAADVLTSGVSVEALLAGMGDRTLAPAIGKAVVTLLGARRAEMARQEEEAWVRVWCAPVAAAMRCDGLRANVQTYVLPGLFKASRAGFGLFVRGLGLEEKEDADGEELMSLLCCLKVGKDLGYVSEEEDAIEEEEGANITVGKKPSTITVPSSFTAPLLFHPHPHVRLAALTLLTHSPAPTHPLPASSLAALRAALPSLHTESDAEVRDQTVQSLRNLLERLAASSHHLSRARQNLLHHPHPAGAERRLAAQIDAIRAFTVSFVRELQTQLHPGSSYQRATTALKLLTALLRPDTTAKRTVGCCPAGVSVLGAGMQAVLREAVFNPFDDVRAMAAEALGFAGRGAVDRSLLREGVERMDASGRERDADGVARVVALLWRGGEAAVVAEVLDMLEARLRVARADFQAAVRRSPVHGLLAGLRMVLERGDAWAGGGAGREVVHRVVAACREIWEITRDVLCVDSPEGCVPAGVVGEDDEEDDEDEDEGLNSQTVMSYSWRAVKESSSLLATVLSRAPYDPANPATSPLHASDFPTAGALLLSQLTHIRHRGAFSAVSPSFTTLCHTCHTSADPTLRSLPAQWLAQHLPLVTSSASRITRRSAGLPLLLAATLAPEPDTDRRPLLQTTFDHLFAVAAVPPPLGGGGETDLPQVHAINCMKHLFTDARLAPGAARHVGPALALAVDCFGAPAWALRNCGIMLFTALLNRVVGRQRGEDAAAFFARYPGVREVLLGGLRDRVAALDVDVGAAEMVYPALSLLARLRGGDGGFVSWVGVAMEARVWKVREMAARAYAALCGGEEGWTGVAARLLGEAAAPGRRVNGVHGRLCAVRALLENREEEKEDVAVVWAALETAFDALVVRCRCAVIRAVCLQVITDLAVVAAPSDDLHPKIAGYAATAADALAAIHSAGIAGRTLFKTHLTAFLVSRALRDPSPPRTAALTDLLRSTDEEAALSLAEHLLAAPPTLPPALDAALWALTAHPWHQLRTAALRLLYRTGTTTTTATDNWHTVYGLATAAASPPDQRAAALALLGVLAARTPSYLAALTPLLTASAHEEQPQPTREAALHALHALSSTGALQPHEHSHAGALMALYDLLNDDDGALRAGAARAVCCVLGGARYGPLRAADALLDAMMGVSPAPTLSAAAAARLTGGGGAAARGAGGAALFGRERCNLYVDCVVEARRWGRVLASSAAQEGVVGWVGCGLAAMQAGGCGGEEAFAVVVRVVEGVGVVREWARRGEVEGGVWEGVVGRVEALLEAGGVDGWGEGLRDAVAGGGVDR